MQPAVVDLLAQAEAARDQERVHVGRVGKAVVRQHREAGLRLHRPQRLGDRERIELGIEPPRHREHAVRRGEIDDLGVLADIDASRKPGFLG